MGVVLERPLPTYPEGFPPRADRAARGAAMGHEVICNRPYNGIAAIEDFGAEHLRTGALILYTSQDSVLQLAAHVERVPAEELYRACAAARAAMSGEHAVGRVIARPFTRHRGARSSAPRAGATSPWRPPGRSYLQELRGAGVDGAWRRQDQRPVRRRRRRPSPSGRHQRAGARRARASCSTSWRRG